MILSLQNVSLVRQGKHILKNINWKITSGQHWAIVGLNGSGKTTLLNMVNGYLYPSQGKVSVLGKQFGAYDLRKLRQEIGWVSHSLQNKMYGSETAEAIVLSGRFATIGLYDRPAKAERQRAMELLEQFGCGHLANRNYGLLSQGERQRVLIARALFNLPRLLVLDEPCTSLDFFAREQLLKYISEFAKNSNAPTLIYVTHHIEEILPTFSHCLLLREGQVYKSGLTKEILTEPTMATFLGTKVTVHWQAGRPWLRVALSL